MGGVRPLLASKRWIRNLASRLILSAWLLWPSVRSTYWPPSSCSQKHWLVKPPGNGRMCSGRGGSAQKGHCSQSFKMLSIRRCPQLHFGWYFVAVVFFAAVDDTAATTGTSR